MTEKLRREYIEVVGAYGRTYRTLASAKADWLAGLDFRLTTGQYVNIKDAENYNLGVFVRYGKNNEKVGTLR